MLTQRRPSPCDRCSTLRLGSALPARRRAGSAARSVRRSLGFGRFGIGLASSGHRSASIGRLDYATGHAAKRRRRMRLVYCAPHRPPHLEGWRDWPDEAPATPPGLQSDGEGANSSRWMSLEDVSGKSHSGPLLTPAEVFFVATETGRRSRTDVSRGAEVQGVRDRLPARGAATSASSCFGPLEVAYDYSARSTPASAKRQDPGGLAAGSGATPTSCRSTGRARRSALEPGLTPLVRADRLAEQLGRRRALDQERRRQPDPLVQGPRRRGRARQGAASSASTPSPAPRPATSPTPSPPTPPPPASTPTSSSPPTSRSRSCSRPASTARPWSASSGNYDDVNRLCTELAETRGWAFVNVNLRPYYAEGSKTLAYETVEQLGWQPARPGRLPDRLRLAVHEDRPRLPRVARPRPRRGRAAGVQRRPGRRAAARSRPPSPRATTSAGPSEPDTIAKSLAIGNPADGPYALELARTHRRLDRRGQRRRDPRRDPAARRDDRDLHRDRRRRDDRRPRASSPSAARSAPASASSSTSPARG